MQKGEVVLKKERLKLMLKLIIHGANVSILNHEGQSPLHLILYHEQISLLARAKGNSYFI